MRGGSGATWGYLVASDAQRDSSLGRMHSGGSGQVRARGQVSDAQRARKPRGARPPGVRAGMVCARKELSIFARKVSVWGGIRRPYFRLPHREGGHWGEGGRHKGLPSSPLLGCGFARFGSRGPSITPTLSHWRDTYIHALAGGRRSIMVWPMMFRLRSWTL